MKTDLLQKVLSISFDNPAAFDRAVDDEVTRNRRLMSKERRELTDLLFDCVRWRRRIWGEIFPSNLDPESLHKKLEDARSLRATPPMARWSTLSVDALARELSFPTWILERWVAEFGFTSAVPLALSLNEPAPLTIRANELKTDRATLKKALAAEDVPSAEGKHSPWALHLKDRVNIRSLKAFKLGWFEAQDEASQLAVIGSGAKAGDTVVDVGAGTGGKTLAFAALMANQGGIVAVDSDSRKEEEFKARCKRNGVKIARFRWVAQDDPNPLAELKEQADVVLVDAPCSSLGTLRRRPALKWETGPASIPKLAARQIALLKRSASLVKPNGRLVYVTCTINKEENSAIVERFLQDEPGFAAPSAPKTLRPDAEGTDGFFVATLVRHA
ncbi:MAG: RsmB/NOP family class I SAM-dependent RNA methyltransferase [Pseudomonadota bacterium]